MAKDMDLKKSGGKKQMDNEKNAHTASTALHIRPVS